MLPLDSAAFVATVAKSVAESVFKDPPKLPNGVLFAATMKMFCIFIVPLCLFYLYYDYGDGWVWKDFPFFFNA
jgi:hypothetical protein